MNDHKKDRPGVAAPERSAEPEKACDATTNSGCNSIMCDPPRQTTVARFLALGRKNAVPGSDLVNLLELKNLRDLTQMIERERCMGAPICATTDQAHPGYYLADGPDELEKYIQSLSRRIHNVARTMTHLEDTLLGMTGQGKIEGWECGER